MNFRKPSVLVTVAGDLFQWLSYQYKTRKLNLYDK